MTSSPSLALVCDLHGNISQILRNSFGTDMHLRNGMPFARLAPSGSLSKALSFITEINGNGVAFDWEINILAGEQVKTLHFTGGRAGKQILVVGAENGRFALQLYEELIRINNEQTNALRASLKDQVESARSEIGDSQFNEISRLNNELVAMQRELAKKNTELARLNDLKNQFLGMAAHDLRNPLQAILLYSEFLLDELSGKLDASQAEFLTTIHDQSQYMAHLVNDLLDVSSIESGNLQLDLHPVDLVGLVQTNLTRNRLLAARKTIALIMEATPLPRLMLDAAKIEQVLDNLVSNAVKFSPHGSCVHVNLHSTGEQILLSVKDEGPGITPEQISRLFKPFQRGQKGTAGESSTGLGLTIVKRIVEGHGGKIWPESQVGAGATFFVSLPFHPEEVRG